MTDMMQSRHNDYNYQNVPAVRKNLENFPLKQIIFNWNFLSLDLKATADLSLKRKYISQYSYEIDCPHDCFNCKNVYFLTTLFTSFIFIYFQENVFSVWLF